MKKAINAQVAILIFAILIALSITIFVGSTATNPQAFYWNTILINITFVGDGLFAFSLVLFLLFYFKQKVLAYNLCKTILFTLLCVQVLKNIFSDLPLQFFVESNLNTNNSLFYHNYISSHTSVAISIAVFFSMHFKNLGITVLLFAVAILVAYSRVLLANETFVAILLSLIPSVGTYFIVKKINNSNRFTYRYYFKKSKHKKFKLEKFLGV